MTTSSQPRRIGLLGGSFDPIHHGHLAFAQAAQKKAALDQVIFLPCQQSPHKSQSTAASHQQRADMIRLAILPHSTFILDRFDLDRPSPCYSWETALHFKTKHPTATLFWLLGADQWEKIHLWNNPEFLRENLTFLIRARHGHLLSRPNWNANVVSGEHPATATKIRANLSHPDHQSWLSANVFHYIQQHGLYQSIQNDYADSLGIPFKKS